MLTARTTITDRLDGFRSGADDYSVNPFLMDELKARILNLLTLRERIKYHPVQVTETRKKTQLSPDDQFIARVIKIIDENISDFDFDVGILHERLGMSRMHLSRKLKIVTGLSPHILIRNIRMEKAAELLLMDAGNITEIANSIGISNASGFSKAFREYFGISPKKYAKQ
jgi:AraC-like DNA-binding protein